MTEITIHLDVIKGRYLNTITQVNRLVSVGLQMAMITPDEYQISTPDSMIQIGRSPKGDQFKNYRDQYNIWLIRGGVRDLVEVTNYYLEEVRLACTLFSKFPGELTQEEINHISVKEREDFLEEGLPKKIRVLKKDFKLKPKLSSSVCSLNSVRNCLVHRFGHVAKKDVGKKRNLKLKYYSYGLFSEKNGKRKLITPDNNKIEEGSIVKFSIENVEKIFQLGDVINFSTREFSDICMTLISFGAQMDEEIQKYAKERGINVQIKPK